MFVSLFFNSLFWNNEFTKVRQDSLNFESIMNPTHYELITIFLDYTMLLSLVRNNSI